jgi:hypothetical protein
MIEAISEKDCGDILNKALVYGNTHMHYPVSAIAGMKSSGTWMIDIAFHPNKFAEEIIKAAKKQHPKAPKVIPDTEFDVTSLFQRLERNGWIVANTGLLEERALIVCFVLGGVRFAELARMTWENGEFSDGKIVVIIKIKNSQDLGVVTYRKLTGCGICPVQALKDVRQREAIKQTCPPEECAGPIWTTAASQPMSADQIGTAVSAALKKMGLPAKRPYHW